MRHWGDDRSDEQRDLAELKRQAHDLTRRLESLEHASRGHSTELEALRFRIHQDGQIANYKEATDRSRDRIETAVGAAAGIVTQYVLPAVAGMIGAWLAGVFGWIGNAAA